jgi:hypothetical protein
VWDLQQLNGSPVTGEAPTGVPVRRAGGSDSTVTVLQSFSITFSSGSACSWTFDDGLSSPVTQDQCEYTVAADGTVSLDLVGLFDAVRSVTGTAERDLMTLADQDTNVFELRKRS